MDELRTVSRDELRRVSIDELRGLSTDELRRVSIYEDSLSEGSLYRRVLKGVLIEGS